MGRSMNDDNVQVYQIHYVIKAMHVSNRTKENWAEIKNYQVKRIRDPVADRFGIIKLRFEGSRTFQRKDKNDHLKCTENICTLPFCKQIIWHYNQFMYMKVSCYNLFQHIHELFFKKHYFIKPKKTWKVFDFARHMTIIVFS